MDQKRETEEQYLNRRIETLKWDREQLNQDIQRTLKRIEAETESIRHDIERGAASTAGGHDGHVAKLAAELAAQCARRDAVLMESHRLEKRLVEATAPTVEELMHVIGAR